jgi:cobalt-zinc-cadmium efflux system membrane fusion protein
VVREGDGTMTAWVTADRRHFTKRTVKIGEERDGYRQILEGVQVGELVATEGALFLSNTLRHGVGLRRIGPAIRMIADREAICA